MLLQALRFEAGVLVRQVPLAVVQLVSPIDHSE
jgi:hypothetical protein